MVGNDVERSNEGEEVGIESIYREEGREGEDVVVVKYSALHAYMYWLEIIVLVGHSCVTI